MSLIVYECQRAGHAHEIRQFGAAAQSLYDYFDGRDETALFIGYNTPHFLDNCKKSVSLQQKTGLSQGLRNGKSPDYG